MRLKSLRQLKWLMDLDWKSKPRGTTRHMLRSCKFLVFEKWQLEQHVEKQRLLCILPSYLELLDILKLFWCFWSKYDSIWYNSVRKVMTFWFDKFFKCFCLFWNQLISRNNSWLSQFQKENKNEYNWRITSFIYPKPCCIRIRWQQISDISIATFRLWSWCHQQCPSTCGLAIWKFCEF